MGLNVKHLIDRPCNVCEFHKENGCCKWDCVFEKEPSAEDKLERIREILDKAPYTLYFRMIREVVEDGNDD